jgi:hypothetical protein
VIIIMSSYKESVPRNALSVSNFRIVGYTEVSRCYFRIAGDTDRTPILWLYQCFDGPAEPLRWMRKRSAS